MQADVQMGRLPGLCDGRTRNERVHYLRHLHTAAQPLLLHDEHGEHGGMKLQESQSFCIRVHVVHCAKCAVRAMVCANVFKHRMFYASFSCFCMTHAELCVLCSMHPAILLHCSIHMLAMLCFLFWTQGCFAYALHISR